MKNIRRAISMLMALIFVLTGCTQNVAQIQDGDINLSQENSSEDNKDTSDGNNLSMPLQENAITEEQSYSTEIISDISVEQSSLSLDDVNHAYQLKEPDFYGINDPDFIEYIEAIISSELEAELTEDCIVEDVSAIYISKEYIEELVYNSKENIYFGYSLEDVERSFEGTKYVFSLGDDGTTVVTEFEDYNDIFNQVVRNVAIGTGVILISVTVSVVTDGMGAYAVSAIFAASAKEAAEFALLSGVTSAVLTTVVEGYRTGNWREASKDALLVGSEDFRSGALTGMIVGATYESLLLKMASLGGLTMNEVALILKENNLSARFLRQIHTYDEYKEIVEIAEKAGLTIEEFANICIRTKYPLEVMKLIRNAEEVTIYDQARLFPVVINDQVALIRDIDLSYESDLAGRTVTNLERMKLGNPPINPLTGESYELHHIGQTVDSPLAILTMEEHRGSGNYSTLHDSNTQGVHSILSDSEWASQRADFWRSFAMRYE